MLTRLQIFILGFLIVVIVGFGFYKRSQTAITVNVDDGGFSTNKTLSDADQAKLPRGFPKSLILGDQGKLLDISTVLADKALYLEKNQIEYKTVFTTTSMPDKLQELYTGYLKFMEWKNIDVHKGKGGAIFMTADGKDAYTQLHLLFSPQDTFTQVSVDYITKKVEYHQE